MPTTNKSRLLEAHKALGSPASRKIKSFFVSKGYSVCNVTPISQTTNWFAILIKNKEFVLATVFTNGTDIERYEASVMP